MIWPEVFDTQDVDAISNEAEAVSICLIAWSIPMSKGGVHENFGSVMAAIAMKYPDIPTTLEKLMEYSKQFMGGE
jgi:hypothetical protein